MEDVSPAVSAHEGGGGPNSFSTTSLRYAGLLTRLPALLIDLVLVELVHIFFLLVGAAALALGIISGDMGISPLDLVLSLTAPIMILYLVVFSAYFTFFHAKGGQTPGKMILHIRVIADTNPLHQISAPQALFRTMLFGVSCFFFYFSILMVLLDKKKRSLHDLMVGSCVIREGKA